MPSKIKRYSIKLTKEHPRLYKTNMFSIDDYSTVLQMFAQNFKDLDREIFSMIMLDENKKIIGINDISIGSLNSTTVHPREIFKVALAANAKYIILGHNHPSGDLTPSKYDIAISNKMRKCGNVLDVQIINSLILGIDGTTKYNAILSNFCSK